jgi:hypothetical protein
MSTPPISSEYMLLFKGTLWDRELSPEELQQVMTRWMNWLNRLTQEGKVKSAHPLANQGKTITWKKGAPIDGPFAESKEAIGGYFLLQVSEAEALEIARECPALKYGVTVEVRPIVDQCAAMERVYMEHAIGSSKQFRL